MMRVQRGFVLKKKKEKSYGVESHAAAMIVQ